MTQPEETEPLARKFDMLRGGSVNSLAEQIELLQAIKGTGPESLVDLWNLTNLQFLCLVDIKAILEGLATTVELLNNNQSANTQAIIGATISSSCGCEAVLDEDPNPAPDPQQECGPLVITEGFPGPGQSLAQAIVMPVEGGTFRQPNALPSPQQRVIIADETGSEILWDVPLGQGTIATNVPAGTYQVLFKALDSNPYIFNSVQACWIEDAPPSDLCQRAQAIVAGFEKAMAYIASRPVGTVLDKTTINIIYANMMAYMPPLMPPSSNVQTLLSIFSQFREQWNWSLFPNGLSSGQREALVFAILSGAGPQEAADAFLFELEQQIALEDFRMDFLKSLPTMAQFNVFFDQVATGWTLGGFSPTYCEPE